MQPVYQPEESNETLQVSTHSKESKESQGGDSKRYAIDETIKLLAVDLCMLEKKAGEKKVSNMISTIRRDDFSMKMFLKHVTHLGECKNIFCSII